MEKYYYEVTGIFGENGEENGTGYKTIEEARARIRELGDIYESYTISKIPADREWTFVEEEYDLVLADLYYYEVFGNFGKSEEKKGEYKTIEEARERARELGNACDSYTILRVNSDDKTDSIFADHLELSDLAQMEKES